jgi:hypothetical protein
LVGSEGNDLRWEDLIGMICSILEWINFDDEEGSKIKCGPNGPSGRFHVSIHVSATSYGTNDRGPHGSEVAMVDENLETLEGHNF